MHVVYIGCTRANDRDASRRCSWRVSCTYHFIIRNKQLHSLVNKCTNNNNNNVIVLETKSSRLIFNYYTSAHSSDARALLYTAHFCKIYYTRGVLLWLLLIVQIYKWHLLSFPFATLLTRHGHVYIYIYMVQELYSRYIHPVILQNIALAEFVTPLCNNAMLLKSK